MPKMKAWEGLTMNTDKATTTTAKAEQPDLVKPHVCCGWHNGQRSLDLESAYAYNDSGGAAK